MTVTIAGKEHVTLRDAAKMRHENYMALLMRLKRHPEIPRMRIGRMMFVRLEDLRDYDRLHR